MKRTHLAAAVLALLAAVPAAAQGDRPVTIGAFHYVHQTDPITDADASAVVVDEQAQSFMKSMMLWRCEKDGYSIAVRTHLFTMDDEVATEWRFDQEEPQQGAWQVTQSHDMWVPSDVANDFTEGARRARRVAIRFTLASGEQQTVIFPLTGASAAFARLPCLDWRNYPQNDTTASQR